MIGDRSAVGVLNMECFNKNRTGVRIGSIKIVKRFLIKLLIGNHEIITYRNRIISSTIKKTYNALNNKWVIF